MSFAALALRMTTVKALRGRTIAGQHVLDSPLSPFEKIAGDPAREYPFVAVYSGPSVELPNGLDLFASHGTHVLAFELGVAAHMRVADPDTGREQEGWTMAASDTALAIMIEGLNMQLRRALMAPANPWGELWLRIVTSISKIESQRGGDGSQGVRFAALQSMLTLTTLREPTPGRQLGPVWSLFFELAAADPDMSPQVGILREMAHGASDAWPEYAQIRAGVGLAHDHMRLLFPSMPRVDP